MWKLQLFIYMYFWRNSYNSHRGDVYAYLRLCFWTNSKISHFVALWRWFMQGISFTVPSLYILLPTGQIRVIYESTAFELLQTNWLCRNHWELPAGWEESSKFYIRIFLVIWSHLHLQMYPTNICGSAIALHKKRDIIGVTTPLQRMCKLQRRSVQCQLYWTISKCRKQ